MDIRVKFADSRSNRCLDIGGAHFVMDDDDTKLLIPNEHAKFRDLRLNRSGEIRPQAAACRTYGSFSNA